jgi:hypothetical protein
MHKYWRRPAGFSGTAPDVRCCSYQTMMFFLPQHARPPCQCAQHPSAARIHQPDSPAQTASTFGESMGGGQVGQNERHIRRYCKHSAAWRSAALRVSEAFFSIAAHKKKTAKRSAAAKFWGDHGLRPAMISEGRRKGSTRTETPRGPWRLL